MTTRGPARKPCPSCPYRRDVPPGVWDVSEYAKLPLYDRVTMGQPMNAFACHQQNGRLCAGWVGCHDMDESLSFRLISRWMSLEDVEATLTYQSPVPLFESGQQACVHGLSEYEAISDKARSLQEKITKRHQKGRT